jgi:hypothetical protein
VLLQEEVFVLHRFSTTDAHGTRSVIDSSENVTRIVGSDHHLLAFAAFAWTMTRRALGSFARSHVAYRNIRL